MDNFDIDQFMALFNGAIICQLQYDDQNTYKFSSLNGNHLSAKISSDQNNANIHILTLETPYGNFERNVSTDDKTKLYNFFSHRTIFSGRQVN